MKLENQVCSLGLAEKLKELGVIQDSLFYHTHSKWGVMPKSTIDFTGDPTSAFTVAELGELLPKFCCSKLGLCWAVGQGLNTIKFKSDTEANARAKMLIYLIKEKLLTTKQVKGG